MNLRGFVAVLFAACLLGGCKLVIVVPEGGSVKSQSGDRDCAEGMTCPFDIRDLTFSDVFEGVGKGDSRFLGWKIRPRGLCGGNPGPCALSTAGLAANPNLLGILDTDEEFYLEAVFFSPPSGGAIGNRRAGECLNPQLLAAGSTLEMKSRTTNLLGGRPTLAHISVTGTGQARFEGQNTQRAVSEIKVTLRGRETTSTSETYFQVQAGQQRVINLGGTGDTYVNGVLSGSVHLANSPGVVTRYDLRPGQSYSQEYTVDSTTISGGSELASTAVFRQDTTYVGVVRVTVPAGTFDACQFEITTTEIVNGNDGLSSSFTIWYAVGSGVDVKQVNQAATVELISASIDGNPI